jgi:glycerophosphoryl diester phosphodiesterase
MIHDVHFSTLDRSIPSEADYQLALKYAPRIRFDTNEPFLPSVVGYTVFRQTSPSSSFPRTIEVADKIATVIEYAIWWDWDIEHLYELEHIWVLLDNEGNLIGGEASWHGGMHVMLDETERLPIEDGRLTVHSEPGKHAFAPSPKWLQERRETTVFSCGRTSGYMGVHVTPLFKGRIHDRTILNNRLVHTYLERQAFQPSYEFTKTFDLESAVFVPWARLNDWIPSRVSWWTQELNRTIPPHERRGLRIAHRGASAYAQENSAASFRKAFELGSDMVEVDIRITADDVPVIAHDSSLKRLYGIDANISELTLEELQAATQSSPIMTFEETAKTCRELRLGLYLDIKELSWSAAESIFASIERHDLTRYTIFGSFRPDHIAEIKSHRPDALTSILFNSTHLDPVLLAQSINADFVHPCWENRAREPHKLLTPDWIRQVREANLGIVCWHEERPSEIEALWNLGVDAICSDMPELLVRSKQAQK